jgi:hypothetical protein
LSLLRSLLFNLAVMTLWVKNRRIDRVIMVYFERFKTRHFKYPGNGRVPQYDGVPLSAKRWRVRRIEKATKNSLFFIKTG